MAIMIVWSLRLTGPHTPACRDRGNMKQSMNIASLPGPTSLLASYYTPGADET